MVGSIALIYLIKRLERGGDGIVRTEPLDPLEHEEMGVRRWRRMLRAWWDQVTRVYVGVGS